MQLKLLSTGNFPQLVHESFRVPCNVSKLVMGNVSELVMSSFQTSNKLIINKNKKR